MVPDSNVSIFEVETRTHLVDWWDEHRADEGWSLVAFNDPDHMKCGIIAWRARDKDTQEVIKNEELGSFKESEFEEEVDRLHIPYQTLHKWKRLYENGLETNTDLKKYLKVLLQEVYSDFLRNILHLAEGLGVPDFKNKKKSLSVSELDVELAFSGTLQAGLKILGDSQLPNPIYSLEIKNGSGEWTPLKNVTKMVLTMEIGKGPKAEIEMS